uniref:NADH dehydrogenase [ubiquinone] 1 beta subcomplex subunit 1 n=1 Tax=Mus spicilegus TaxID=10103 RepID=A0A8C6ICA2_MUSSI
MKLVGDYWVHILVHIKFVIECYLNKKNDEKLTAFWSKAVMFKTQLRTQEEILTW